MLKMVTNLPRNHPSELDNTLARKTSSPEVLLLLLIHDIFSHAHTLTLAIGSTDRPTERFVGQPAGCQIYLRLSRLIRLSQRKIIQSAPLKASARSSSDKFPCIDCMEILLQDESGIPGSVGLRLLRSSPANRSRLLSTTFAASQSVTNSNFSHRFRQSHYHLTLTRDR